MPIWTEEGKGRSGALKGGGEKGKRVEEIGRERIQRKEFGDEKDGYGFLQEKNDHNTSSHAFLRLISLCLYISLRHS